MREVNKRYEERGNRSIDLALDEDTGQGEITSQILIPPELKGRASILAKEKGVLAGGDVARLVFRRVDPSLEIAVLIPDGNGVKPGDTVATISGSVASILKAERVALNLLSRLSGIASETARYVARAEGLSATITDTRKTSPGLRVGGKDAGGPGGGQKPRIQRGDGILMKDNHRAALRKLGLSLQDIIARARQGKGLDVEIETSTVREALDAARAGADVIMLDNMKLDDIKRVVELAPERVKIEASGGIVLDNVRAVAMAGVDTISVGALTHSAKALDFSLELD